MSSLNDELFALRISLQDNLMDEINIIKELKLYLRSKNIPSDEINNNLVEFYKSFNIEFPLEFISNIQPNPQMVFNPSSISSLLFNSNNHFYSDDLNNAAEDSDDDSVSDNSDDSDIDDSDDDNDVINEANNIDDDILEDNNNTEEEIINNTNQIFNSIFSSTLSNPPNSSFFQMSFNNGQTSFTTNSNTNIPQFQNINTITNPEDFINNFTNLLNSLNIQNINNMEDVKVTLDENELEKIESKTLDEDLNEKCSICMMDMKKGEKYSKLPCSHGFHTDCVMHWLKEYNYKCPVCREECGQAKYHI